MADDEEIFVDGLVADEAMEVLDGGLGGEGVGVEDAGLVADFSGDELGGLKGALERAGDDEIEGDFEGGENVGEAQGVLLAFFIEGGGGRQGWGWGGGCRRWRGGGCKGSCFDDCK